MSTVTQTNQRKGLKMEALKDPEAWKRWVVSHADYWTAVRFKGAGKYERHEFKTWNEAHMGAKMLSLRYPGSNWMIYCVAGVHDVYITTVTNDGTNHAPDPTGNIGGDAQVDGGAQGSDQGGQGGTEQAAG